MTWLRKLLCRLLGHCDVVTVAPGGPFGRRCLRCGRAEACPCPDCRGYAGVVVTDDDGEA